MPRSPRSTDGGAREGVARRARDARRRLPRRILVALVLTTALVAGPARAVTSVLRGMGHDFAFLPAFSAEPTVSVSIGHPGPGARVGRYVSIEATALADAGLARVLCTADGGVVSDIAPPSTPTAWRFSSVWDSHSTSEGSATIEVVAVDIASRAATCVVTVRVDHTPPRVTFSPAPADHGWAFSPNGDRRRDSLGVVVSSSEAARVHAVVRRGSATRMLVDAGPRATRVRFTWNGTMTEGVGGKTLSDGAYPLRVTVTDEAGNAVEATHPAIIDRKAPAVAWSSPRPRAFWPARRQRSALAARASDALSGVMVGADMRNDAGAVVRRIPPKARRDGAVRVLWDGRYANGKVVPPGEYGAELVVSDHAGNTTRLAGRRARVHAVRKPTTIVSVRTKKKVVALTFDDLYSAPRTRAILGILRAHKAKATFFVVGAAASANRAVMREIVADGHILANHSQSHPVMTRITPAAQRAQMRACEVRVSGIVGRSTAPLFRPPYGATDAKVAASAAAEEHPYVFLWDIDTMDWASPGVARLAGAVSRGLRPGSIVLMHGGPPQTPKALPRILNTIKARGYRTVTLPELLWIGGYR